jgi:hypothetical protein
MARLATVIDEARRRAFVGRRAELARFDAMVAGGDPRRVLFVHGPGGIGKTLLLGELEVRARAAGRVTVGIDAREVDWSPEGLRSAFDRAAERAGGEPTVVLLDGYERFGRVDEWVRGELVPSLPAETVVVLAGREPPPAPWTTDPGWRALTYPHPLGQLSPDESRELVRRAGAPADLVDRLAELGHGHPLTLALLADAARTGDVPPDDLAGAPDLVAALVARVVGEVPSRAHATALAVCTHAWLTTEDLLRRAVGDEAPAVWRWLESRPFVTRTPDGLHPHELVRDALEADLLRRSRETYRRVHRIVHEHVVVGLRRTDAFGAVLWAHQKMWLHRRSPLSAMYLAIRENQPTTLVAGDRRDHPAVLDLIERIEGAASAAAAARWLDAEPQNLQVIRADGGLAAFAYNVLWPTDPALCAADPVVRAIVDHVAGVAPARPGEQVWIGRYVGGPNGFQRDPYAVTVAAMAATIDWVRRPLAWSFVPAVDAEFWGPALDYIAFRPTFEISAGGPRYTVYGNDWRRLPVDAWLDVLDERELTGRSGPPPPEVLRPPPLDRAAFDAAVRTALGEMRRPDRLRANPLMGTILAFGYDGADVTRLRAVLDRAIDQIGREPRGDGLARVLDRTFRHGAPSQEAAAAVLDLPFSTYRRHLGSALQRLTDLLWEVEIGRIRLDDLAPGEHEVSKD